MTEQERIENLEKEVLSLKEELRSSRKADVWKEVKNQFADEFNSFNWIYRHTFTNCNGLVMEHRNDMNESYHISQAIGTLVRIVLKRKRLNYLEESDTDKAKRITKGILEVMKKEEEKICGIS